MARQGRTFSEEVEIANDKFGELTERERSIFVFAHSNGWTMGYRRGVADCRDAVLRLANIRVSVQQVTVNPGTGPGPFPDNLH